MFQIPPDLSCFGKVIGGGLPVGAFGGRAEIMDCLAPLGPVYQAGTLSGNPLAMAAGIAALEELDPAELIASSKNSGNPRGWVKARCEKRRRSGPVQPPRLHVLRLFHRYPVHNLEDAMKSDRDRFKAYFHAMLNEGIYLAPSQFEAGFISAAHTSADIEKTIRTAAKVMKHIKRRSRRKEALNFGWNERNLKPTKCVESSAHSKTIPVQSVNPGAGCTCSLPLSAAPRANHQRPAAELLARSYGIYYYTRFQYRKFFCRVSERSSCHRRPLRSGVDRRIELDTVAHVAECGADQSQLVPRALPGSGTARSAILNPLWS